MIGLLALSSCAFAAVSAVRQGLAGSATGFCRGAAKATADTCGPGALIRVTGTFSNPNLLAAFLVLLLPLAAVGSAALAERASRMLGTGVVVLGYLAVLLTASRGGVLGAVAGAGAACDERTFVRTCWTRALFVRSAPLDGVAQLLIPDSAISRIEPGSAAP